MNAAKNAANRPQITPPVRQLIRQIIRLRLVWIILVAFLLLSGCVRDDLGLSFRDANHGTLTQQIRFSSQLVGISQVGADLWLEALSKQTTQMGGKVGHPAEREWLLTVPFHNVKELEQKFEQFEGLIERSASSRSSSTSSPTSSSTARPAPISTLKIASNNLILGQRHHLSYDLDLRSLGIVPNVTNTATVLVDPKELLVLDFQLKTPWGARLPKTATANTLAPAVYRNGKQLVWTLKPGEANHLEAVFWLPSSVGIGSAFILGLVIIGMFLKAWVEVSDPVAQIPMPKV